MAKKNRKRVGQFQIPALNNASRTLLANIRFTSIDEKVKTIAVTSTGPDEGKTVVCANLACAIADSGKRVLLVDTDMRRRCIGTMLNIHPRYGLYSVLAGSAQLQSAITPTKKPGLFFMDSEPNIPSPPDVLSTKRFAALVDQLRGMFDYVIFDTPPVGVFVDAAIISNLVDGTVYAIRERGEKRDNIVAGVQQLKTANARILGTVITFSQEESQNDYYYAYYNEEGKRVSKREKDEPVVDESADARDIAADDIEQWARKAGIDPQQAVRAGSQAVERQREARQAAAHQGMHSPMEQFPTGAFRAVGSSKTPRHKSTRI